MAESEAMTPTARSYACQILDASYNKECALVMAQAFADSPSYLYLFQDMEERRDRVRALEWLFQRNLDLMATKCPSALRGVLDDKGHVIVCFLWTPAPFQKLSPIEMLTAGLWQVPFRFGFATLTRIMNVVDDMDDATQQIYQKHYNDDTLGKHNYIMLERMVVRPEWQGQGHGSRALQQVLEEEDHATRKHVHLSTQETRNVTFYQRLGFASLDDRVYYEKNEKFQFTSWTMIRQGKSKNYSSTSTEQPSSASS